MMQHQLNRVNVMKMDKQVRSDALLYMLGSYEEVQFMNFLDHPFFSSVEPDDFAKSKTMAQS